MEVQAVLEKAREKVERAHDGAPPPAEKRKTPKVRAAVRAVLPLVVLAALAALLRPRRPAKRPASRFPIPLPFR